MISSVVAIGVMLMGAEASCFGAEMAAKSVPGAQVDADARLRDAHLAVAQGDYRHAISLYTELLQGERVEPAFLATVYRERGLANQMANSPTAAIADYTNAIWLNASPPELQAKAYVGRGLAYLSLTQLAQAVREFDAAVAIAPALSEAYFGRATARRLSGADQLAFADYTKALELGSPTPELVYYGRGLVYEAMDQKQSAESDYREAVSARPGFAPARERLTALAAPQKAPTTQTAQAPTVPAQAGEVKAASAAPAVPVTVAAKEPDGGRGEGGPPAVVASAAPPASAPANVVASNTAAADQALADEPTGALTPSLASRPPTVLATRTAPAADAVALRPSSDGVLATPPSAPQVAPPAPEAKAPPQRVASVAPTVVSPPVAAAKAQARVGGFYVQTASYGNRAPAEAAKKALSAKFTDVAGTATVAEGDLGAKGTFYRVRLGPYGDRSAANDVCVSLRKRGQTCVVVAGK